MTSGRSIIAALFLVAAAPVRGADLTISTVAGMYETITFNAPQGVAVDGSDCVYIADTGSHKVVKYNPSSGYTTVAGTGSAGYSGNGGAATAAKLDQPYDVAVDSSGNLYIADKGNHVVRKVAAGTGIITTVAGTGSAGYTGDGGAATAAKLGDPFGVAVDASGNVYIADKAEHVVRKVTVATGVISTVAGTGSDGYTGDGGAATAAKISEPYDVAVAAGTNHVYIASKKKHVVRKVDGTTGIISTFAGNGTSGYDGDGGAATSAKISEPSGVCVDSSGNVYIANRNKHVVRLVTVASGVISSVAGTGSAGYTGDGDLATAAELDTPFSLALNSLGNLYIADSGNDTVREVLAEDSTIRSINASGSYGGDGGLAVLAKLSTPWDMAVDSDKNIYIADTANHVVRYVAASTGIITTVAGTGVSGYTGDGGAATSAKLGDPYGVAVAADGDLYIADKGKHVVRKVDSTGGVITTIAGTGSAGYTGDGGAATSAKLDEPFDVALDETGNVFIACNGSHVVRKVTVATGAITTFAGTGSAGYTGDGGAATAAKLGDPYGLAVDRDGNVYIADKGKHVIRKVTIASGVITTIAGTGSAGYTGDGGAATSAKLEEPHDVAVDRSGNVFIACKKQHVIRRVDGTTGVITTVAGTAVQGYSGDGGLATAATMSTPYGVGVSREGDLYIADSGNNVIRMVDLGDPGGRIVSWTEVEP